MSIINLIVVGLTALGAFFFFAGTIGVLRFPDTTSRLHALTKADNLGLGFMALGVGLYSANLIVFFKLVLIWLLALISSATASYLIAKELHSEKPENGDEPSLGGSM